MIILSKKIRVGLKKKCEKIKLFGSEEIFSSDMAGVPNIHIYGNKEVLLEGCSGIIEYTAEIIKINMGKGTVSFLGKNLFITMLEEKNITINGEISSIEFCV